MDDFRKDLAEVLQELDRDKDSPENKAIRDVIAVVRNFYYNKGSPQQRVKDIRVIISKAVEE